MTEEKLAWTVFHHPDGKVEVSVKDGTHAGWARQSTESESRKKALARLRYAQDEAAQSRRRDIEAGLA